MVKPDSSAKTNKAAAASFVPKKEIACQGIGQHQRDACGMATEMITLLDCRPSAKPVGFMIQECGLSYSECAKVMSSKAAAITHELHGTGRKGAGKLSAKTKMT